MAWLYDYPREKVNWHPTIDESKCVRCGICMNCGNGVFEWIEGKPVVVKPLSCTVGCTTCANLCKGECISFPDKKELRELYIKENIWGKVKANLIEKGKIK